MVEQPSIFIDDFIKAGADSFIVHYEVLPDPRPLLQRIPGRLLAFGIRPEHIHA